MENNVYLLYTCDAWHSYSSDVLMGVFDSLSALYEGVSELIGKLIEHFAESDETTDETVERIMQEFTDCNMQTQGYRKNIFAKCVEHNKVEEV